MRQIIFPGFNSTAKASYGGQNYNLGVNTGYEIPVARFTIMPLASLQYTNLQVNNFHETGAGAVNLRVALQSYSFLESRLGVKVAREFAVGSGVSVPEIHGKWLLELSNPTLSQTASFAFPRSASFSTPGT